MTERLERLRTRSLEQTAIWAASFISKPAAHSLYSDGVRNEPDRPKPV